MRSGSVNGGRGRRAKLAIPVAACVRGNGESGYANARYNARPRQLLQQGRRHRRRVRNGAAVLRGIEQATTVIYAASPDAASSVYVAHELAIAEGEGKTILPFWIRGERWYFCAPMDFDVAKHIDGSDAAWAGGLASRLAPS
jgi:hypothetical protein